MSMWLAIILCVICFLIGRQDGWIRGHIEIANECKKLGAFCVGSSVFKCVEITKRDD